MTCLKRINRTDTDCPDACNGLFADVRIEPTETAASSHFKTIVEEYVKYKQNYVQNIEFNSSLDSKSFGKLKRFFLNYSPLSQYQKGKQTEACYTGYVMDHLFGCNWLSFFNEQAYLNHFILVQDNGHSGLILVQIFFDTALFDKISQDKKATFETQISVLGGTLGLFSGFSVLSAIEIVYYLFKLFLSFITATKRKDSN